MAMNDELAAAVGAAIMRAIQKQASANIPGEAVTTTFDMLRIDWGRVAERSLAAEQDFLLTKIYATPNPALPICDPIRYPLTREGYADSFAPDPSYEGPTYSDLVAMSSDELAENARNAVVRLHEIARAKWAQPRPQAAEPFTGPIAAYEEPEGPRPAYESATDKLARKLDEEGRGESADS